MMLDAVRRNRIEALMALVALVALYYGAQAFLAFRDARAAYQDALETQRELEADAARYDIVALTEERDRLAAASTGEAFPTSDEVEQHIGVITGLLEDPLVHLGPVVMGELTVDVTNEDVGASGTEVRTYRGVEMSLTLEGDVVDLLSVAERLLSAVPDATSQDVSVTIGTDLAPSVLQLRVLLYSKD